MQTRGDGLPVKKTNAHLGRPVHDDLPPADFALGHLSEGLRPLRMEPPALHGGLEPVSFVDGLDELSVDALRHNGREMLRRRSIGEREALEAAARRADHLGMTR